MSPNRKSVIWAWLSWEVLLALAGFVHLSGQLPGKLGVVWSRMASAGMDHLRPTGFLIFHQINPGLLTWQLGRVARIWVAVLKILNLRPGFGTVSLLLCHTGQSKAWKAAQIQEGGNWVHLLVGRHIYRERWEWWPFFFFFLQFTFYTILEIKWVWQQMADLTSDSSLLS